MVKNMVDDLIIDEQPLDEAMAEKITVKHITYEQPLNELMRACLRLEYLFKQADYCLGNSSIEESSESIVKNIIDILSLLDRPDLKSRITQEFHRYTIMFAKWLETPDISEHALKDLLKQLRNLREYFLGIHGKIAQPLRDNPFIKAIRHHFTFPGDCCIDSPLYVYWLHQSAEKREHDIHAWLDHLMQARAAIDLLLKIARESVNPRDVTAKNGFYHQHLNPETPCQLIRIRLAEDLNYYPEISAGKHRMTVRFLEAEFSNAPEQTKEDVAFKLSCCAI